jgi:hypothetical protein
MSEELVKDPAILDALAHLRAALGAGAFDVVDHWTCDLIAVGIASPRDHRVLVYIAFRANKYDAELELPTLPGDEFPYRVAGQHWELTLDQLADVVAGHLVQPDVHV